MKITPIEIRQKTFEKTFRGYDKDEVNAFLQSLSQEWERLNAEYRDAKMRKDMADKEVAQLREVESSLFKTLKTADDTATSLVDQAKKDADLHRKEAEIEAEKILGEARSHASKILQKAESKTQMVLQNMVNELKLIEREYKTLINYKDNLSLEIKNFLKATLDKVERFEQSDHTTEDFIKKVKQAQNHYQDNSNMSLEDANSFFDQIS